MPPHAFEIKPSKLYDALILFILLISMVISYLVAWPLLVLVGFYGVYLLRQPRLLRGLYYLGDKRWSIETSRQTFEGILKGNSTVTPLVSILNVEIVGQNVHKSYVIFKDALWADQYRQLMVIIRMY